MTENNVKKILHNSFEKFKRNTNLCSMIVFLSMIFAVFGNISLLHINAILGVILLIMFTIAYIIPFFLFPMFFNTANNAASGDFDSKEKHSYHLKLYCEKKKFTSILYFPLIFIVVYFIALFVILLIKDKIQLSPDYLKGIHLIGALLFSIYLAKIKRYNEVVENPKYNIYQGIKNKILLNSKLSRRMIKIYLGCTLIIISIGVASKVLIRPSIIKIVDTNEFINYAQTYDQEKAMTVCAIQTDKLSEDGYTFVEIIQQNGKKIVIWYAKGQLEKRSYIFFDDKCALVFFNELDIIASIDVENEAREFYLINRDIIEYEYKNNRWEIKTHSANNKVRNINTAILNFALVIQIALFVGLATYYSKNKHPINLIV